MVGIKPGTFCVLNRCSATEPQSLSLWWPIGFSKQDMFRGRLLLSAFAEWIWTSSLASVQIQDQVSLDYSSHWLMESHIWIPNNKEILLLCKDSKNNDKYLHKSCILELFHSHRINYMNTICTKIIQYRKYMEKSQNQQDVLQTLKRDFFSPKAKFFKERIQILLVPFSLTSSVNFSTRIIIIKKFILYSSHLAAVIGET